MNPEPRNEADYSERQTMAARRVLVDVGQVLASFVDCLVVVGGWTPDLLLPEAEEPHIGSIDVDLALDAAKLNDGRYAELIKLLLDTKRYRAGEKDFQLVVEVDLKDGEKPVLVEVEFLAPKEVKLKKNKPKLLEDFRVLQVEAASEAFRSPVELRLPGKNVRGAENTVSLCVASLADFLVMKAHAIGGRDKPKDSYDFCYCLEQFPEGMEKLAGDWRKRAEEKNIAKAVEILRESSPVWMRLPRNNWWSFTLPQTQKLKPCTPGVPTNWCKSSLVCFDQMSTHAYTEDQLVEQPAIGLFAELGCAKTQTLRRTRDLPLPRLLSGQVIP